MKTFSIRYMDALGRTRTSELLTFEDNDAAAAHGRLSLAHSPIVEVWRGDSLVVRLFQPVAGAPSQAAPRNLNTSARRRAQREARLQEWDNEGGAAAPGMF